MSDKLPIKPAHLSEAAIKTTTAGSSGAAVARTDRPPPRYVVLDGDQVSERLLPLVAEEGGKPGHGGLFVRHRYRGEGIRFKVILAMMLCSEWKKLCHGGL